MTLPNQQEHLADERPDNAQEDVAALADARQPPAEQAAEDLDVPEGEEQAVKGGFTWRKSVLG